jgi:outer membrane protein assembly factor BamD
MRIFMKKRTWFQLAILIPFTLFLLSGCAKKGIKTIEGDPETLYRQGLTRFNKRDFSEALKRFEQLKSSFPDSPPFTVWAELKIGDCHFFKKEYVEAIAAYEEFKKVHPTHEEIPYVQYQIGMAYFKQMVSLDRDQTFTQKALSNFEYLTANYPPSLFTKKAKEKVEICRKRLADNEFYIGNYYYKKGKFKAASARFKGLIEKFPKMPEEDKTLFLLGKSYLELDQWEKAVDSFNKIIDEYPKSPYYKEAKAFLDQGIKEKTDSLQKNKESKKDEKAEAEPDRIYWVKFEEERRQSVSLLSPPPLTSQSINSTPSEEKVGEIATPPMVEPMQEDRAQAISPLPPESPLPNPSLSSSEDIPPEAATPTPPLEKEKPKKEALQEPGQTKFVDSGQPIDITSDKVETYSKENLIVFKGNVMARQKDIVIHADSLDAIIIEGGKGIEKVIAGGNVKIQQGLRVASCNKAIFYNIDQKVVLTGDPKVWEGNNMVSGDEIIFDIERNQIEVKGGPDVRGKAKIFPGGEFDKIK